MSSPEFNFLPLTLGEMLKRGRLKVPANQRSYAWRERQVRYLLQDFNDAIFGENAESYFLGTIVIVASDDPPAIVDGQQRLATTSIILSRVRDILLEAGRDRSARGIDQTYLENIDIITEESVSRIQMNEENHEFYNAQIRPENFKARSSSMKRADNLRTSNRLMFNASQMIDDYLRDGIKQSPAERQVDYLLRWESFIDKKARVLAVFVSDEFAAYRMFETLNDRGLRASQVDILKNYMFSRCATRLDEAKQRWGEITTLIEPLGSRSASDEDDGQDENDKSSDPLLNFFRHFWITREGPTKARDLAERIRAGLTNENRTLKFLSEAASAARDYVAISKGDDQKWRSYPATARQDIETLISNLRVTQIRPLVFAIAHYLSPEEGAKALQVCVSWSVRFLIAGGRGGMLDTQYSRRAFEIGSAKITKARELREAMKSYVPSNEEFEQSFAVYKTSRQWLARYLIRAIEKKRKSLPCPEYVENENTSQVNLEHVLPVNLSSDWDIAPDVAEASYSLLGNMVLLSSSINTEIGNSGFAKKREAFRRSGYDTTKEIAQYETWGRAEILDRQKKLASFAISTWPLQFAGGHNV